MPTWAVSEPYVSLWLHDRPTRYQPAKGPEFSFKLSHQQRSQRLNLGGSSVGDLWYCSWTTYLLVDARSGDVMHYTPGGAERNYTPDGDTREYFTCSTMLPVRKPESS